MNHLSLSGLSSNPLSSKTSEASVEPDTLFSSGARHSIEPSLEPSLFYFIFFFILGRPKEVFCTLKYVGTTCLVAT